MPKVTTFIYAAIEASALSGCEVEALEDAGYSTTPFGDVVLCGVAVQKFREYDIVLEDAAAVVLDRELCALLHNAVDGLTRLAGKQAHAYVARWEWGCDVPPDQERNLVVGIPLYEACYVP